MADLDFGVDLTSIRERLKLLGYFLTVSDLAAASQALDNIGTPVPAAFVSTSSQVAEKNQLIQGYAQRVQTVVSILFAESAARVDGKLTDRMEQTWRAIARQLCGWTPEGAGEFFQFRSYSIRATGNGLVWGEVLLSTSWRFTLD